ncbi:MAG: Fpg/Nei family DNA glycosylase, partial [Actinobacteria bacterium]|nr:Fpg/Nei family DNA glycosylase [Actinomycetota bacterium]
TGRRLAKPHRHGKWLTAPAGDGASLLLHFGMDGGLDWVPAAELRGHGPGRADRFILAYRDGELRYRSVRKLGGVWLLPAKTDATEVTGPQGPDAMGLRTAELAAVLAGRRGALKPALMDQSVIAGLGNLTVDETLWRARLHPQAPASRLGRARLGRLHEAMQEVLSESVPAGRVPDAEGWLTAARSERGAACPRCGTRLRRRQVGGRTTVWCPRCQRAPRDRS